MKKWVIGGENLECIRFFLHIVFKVMLSFIFTLKFSSEYSGTNPTELRNYQRAIEETQAC